MKSAIYLIGLCALWLLILPFWLCSTFVEWIDLRYTHGGDAKAKERADWKS